MERDVNWVNQTAKGEFDLLMEPGENRFRSLRWDLNDLDPQDISCGNWGVWAMRGKRYVWLLMSLLRMSANDFIDMRRRGKMLNDDDDDEENEVFMYICIIDNKHS